MHCTQTWFSEEGCRRPDLDVNGTYGAREYLASTNVCRHLSGASLVGQGQVHADAYDVTGKSE